MQNLVLDVNATADTGATTNPNVLEDSTMIDATVQKVEANNSNVETAADTAAVAAIVSDFTSNPLAAPVAVEPAEPTKDQIIAYFNTKDKLVVKFVTGVNALLQNIDFLVDEDWINHAIDGLEKSDNTDRLVAQLTTTVTKDLRNKAIEEAEANGLPIKLPTQDQINKAVDVKLLARSKAVQLAKDKRLATARRNMKAQE
jgi:hypothetical protein